MDLAQLAKDPDYLGLPQAEKAKVVEHLASQDADFMSLPDGEKAKVLNHFVGLRAPLRMPEQQLAKATDGMSNGQLFSAAVGKSLYDTGRGLGQLVGLVDQKDIDEAAQRDKALMDTGAGVAGNITGQIAQMALPAGMLSKVGAVQKAGTALNAVRGGSLVMPAIGSAAYAATQPVVSGDSRLGNMAEGALAGAGGQAAFNGLRMGANAVTGSIQDALKKKAIEKAQNATTDELIQAAINAGYKLPPSYIGGGLSARLAEGLSGKIQTKQLAQINNQNVTNEAARNYLNMPKDMPLNEDTVAALRKSYNQPYRDIAEMPADVIGQTTSKSLATGNMVTSDIVKSGKQLVEELKNARFDSKNHWKHFNMTGDPDSLTKAIMLDKQASSIEDAIEKMAEKSGNPSLLNDLKVARKEIAKTHTIERALKADNVDAMAILRAKNKDVPLSDEMLTVAKFAEKFPSISRIPNGGDSVPLSPLDYYGAAGTNAVSGNLLTSLLTPAGRLLARSTVLSKPAQKAMAKKNYDISKTKKLLKTLLTEKNIDQLESAKYAAPALANISSQ